MTRVVIVGGGTSLTSLAVATLVRDAGIDVVTASDTLELRPNNEPALVGVLKSQFMHVVEPPHRNDRPYLKRKKGRS